MGRYRAPPDDDDGQQQEEATAMDWHATYDSATACCLAVASSNTRIGWQEGEGQDNNNDEEEEYSHMNNCELIHCRHSFLLLENERSETTMHYSNLQRRRTLITVVAALAMITSLFVLQRYAPPPPAAIMLNQSPFRTSTTSRCTNDDATTVCDYAGYIHSADHNSSADYSAGATANHHETWASFSHQLMRYVSSVAWYALSNSFRYAWDESRLGCMTFWYEIQLVWSSSKMRESLLAIITSVESHLLRMQAMSRLHTAATDELQQQKNHVKLIDEEISKILSRVPAAHGYRRTQRETADSNNIIMGTTAWSTEDYLRQTIGTSLSPQNLALKIISERIDAWVIVSRSDDVDNSYIHNDTNITSKFNLPPAIGILIVGPEGVGKLRTARRLANYLLPGNNSLEDKVLSGDGGGVLEINVDTRDNVDRLQTSVTETIVNYIYQREEHGSVIIIHHIELMPISIMTDIANVLSGNHNTISYQASNGTNISTSCNGTLFVLTSLQIGARSILQSIKQNHGLKHLNKELLVESVRRELNDYPFEYSSKLASVSAGGKDSISSVDFVFVVAYSYIFSARNNCSYYAVSRGRLTWPVTQQSPKVESAISRSLLDATGGFACHHPILCRIRLC